MASVRPSAALLLALGLAPACATASPTRPVSAVGAPRTVEISATGQVTRSPDQATLQVGVEIEDAPSVEAARRDAASAMNRMLAALDAEGVGPDHRETTSLIVAPAYEYVDRQRRLRGYTARHELEVRVVELDRLSGIVDAAIEAGGDAARFRGLRFELSDPTEARAEARRRAVAKARAGAEELARAANESLGRVLLIREGAERGGPGEPVMRMAMKAESTSTPLEQGEITVTVDVTAIWSLDD